MIKYYNDNAHAIKKCQRNSLKLILLGEELLFFNNVEEKRTGSNGVMFCWLYFTSFKNLQIRNMNNQI